LLPDDVQERAALEVFIARELYGLDQADTIPPSGWRVSG